MVVLPWYVYDLSTYGSLYPLEPVTTKMLGDRSNIFVSIAEATSETCARENGLHYHRQQHNWLISIEPHKHHVPLVQHREPKLIHIKAVKATEDDDDNSYTVRVSDADHVHSSILIAEGVHTSAENVRTLLLQDLIATSSTTPRTWSMDEDNSAHWVRRAIHVLQKQKLVASFDVGHFVSYADGYVAGRLDLQGPAVISYPHRDEKSVPDGVAKTGGKHRF